MREEEETEILAALKAQRMEAFAEIALPDETLVLSEREAAKRMDCSRRRDELYPLDTAAAGRFIDTTLEWGERGFDFLRYFQGGQRPGPASVTSWELQRRLSIEHRAVPSDVESAILAAWRAGLLVRSRALNPDTACDDAYRLDESGEVSRFLRSRLPESRSELNAEDAHRFLAQLFNENSRAPGLVVFSGCAFLSLFEGSSSFTLTDVFKETALYIGHEVRFSRPERLLLEAVVQEAGRCGLLKISSGRGEEYYSITDEGQALLGTACAGDGPLRPAA